MPCYILILEHIWSFYAYLNQDIFYSIFIFQKASIFKTTMIYFII